MFIEILEPRIAPSGLVELVFTQKLLTLKDLVGGDSELTITATATGELTIAPDAATALKLQGSILADGAPLTLPFFAGGINAALGLGADALTLSGHFVGGVKVDLGGGANSFTLADANIAGNLALKGGAFQDSLYFDGDNTVAGAFTPNLGNGDNFVSGGAASLTIGKNLTVQGGTGYNGLNLTLLDLNVGGNVLFKGAGTHNQLNIFAGTLKIAGSVSLISTNGVEVGFALSGNEIFVGGNVTMKSADCIHVNVGLVSSPGSIYVGGNVSINTGKLAELNPIPIVAGETLFIGKALTITASKEMRVEVRGNSTPAPSFIGGALTINGARTAVIQVDGTIAGKVNVAVTGDDVVATVLTGATIEGTLRLLSPVSISTSTATGGGTTIIDNIFADSSITVKDGAGTRRVEIHDALIAGALTIDTGAGADTVILQASDDRGNLYLLGALKILTGAGLDAITMGGNDPNTGVSTRGTAIFIDGGLDLATYTVGTASLLDGVPVLKNLVP
jgi:hypothetical protein